MSAATKLLDMATKFCSPANQSGLAARLDVKPQTISQWKSGTIPFPAGRVAEIARIAHVEPGGFLLPARELFHGQA